MYNIKLRTSKLRIENDGQKQMVETDLDVNFMTLNILKLEILHIP